MYSVISPQEHSFEAPLPERRRSGWLKKIIWTLAFIAFVLVIYLGVHFIRASRDIFVEQQDPSGLNGVLCLLKKCSADTKLINDLNPVPSDDPDRLNVLILGIRGEDDAANGGLLTDTMLLLSINTLTDKAVMVSIPRDLYIDMPGKLSDGKAINIKGKLNEIYAHGYANSQGLTFTSQMISRVTGQYVDRAVLFNFKAFGDIVEALGGIDVTLAKPFSEKQQWGYEFTLPAGKSHLDGEQALYYVRSRYSSSDFDRARRQQEVILAIKKRATELGFLANPSKITGMMSALSGNLKTNFQIWEIKDLTSLAQTLNSSSLKTSVISTDNLLYETHLENKEYVLLPKGDDFKLFREYFKTILQE